MDNQTAINFLDQLRKVLLDDKSWLESTIQPINEVFDKTISALQEQDVPDTNVGDMISRTEAIDAVENITSSMSVCVNIDECHGMKRMQRQVIMELTNLSPVQSEIIYCKNCKYYSPMNKETKTGICNLIMHQNFGDDWFCKGAERRTDELGNN